MNRLFYGLAVLSCAGCASVTSINSVSESSPEKPPVSLFQPQLGLRIASSSYSADLLPRSNERIAERNGDNPTTWDAKNPQSLPVWLTIAPTVSEMGGKIQIVKIVPETITIPDNSYVLSLRALPVSFSELGNRPDLDFKDVPLTDTRFSSQLLTQFHKDLPELWKGNFRVVMEAFPMASDSLDGSANTGLKDPFDSERNFNAKLRGERQLRSLLRRAAKESDQGNQVVESMRNWRDEPLNFVLAFAGGAVEQDTPEGGMLIVGPSLNELHTTDRPVEVFRVRYVSGPFETRAEIKEVWVRCKFNWSGNDFFVRSAKEYFSPDANLQFGVQRKLGTFTSFNFLGGSGLGSQNLTGLSAPNDPLQSDRKLGFMLYFDHRF